MKQAGRHTPVTLGLGRKRQEDQEFKDILSYMEQFEPLSQKNQSIESNFSNKSSKKLEEPLNRIQAGCDLMRKELEYAWLFNLRMGRWML